MKFRTYGILLTALLAQSASAAQLAPYFYAWGGGNTSDYKVSSLMDAKAKMGLNQATLAFAIAGGPCKVIGDPESMASDALSFQASGGKLILSFGGASGPYLEDTCTDPVKLVAEMDRVIQAMGVSAIDFDIEGSYTANPTIAARRNAAIKTLQAKYPKLTVSFTLPVNAPSSWGQGGLDNNGLSTLSNAVSAGVRVDIVNLMTMDYYSAPVNGNSQGDNAIKAAAATVDQLKSIYPGLTDAQLYAKIGITPMIGVNDDASIFALSDAQKVADFSSKNGVGLIAYWALQRDQAGKTSDANNLPLHSGVAQNDYAYYNIFKTASSPTVTPVPTVNPTPTAKPTPSPTVTPGPAGSKKVIGYFTAWGIYGRNYQVTDIPADLVTHINYAFANISGGLCVQGDPWADSQINGSGNFGALNKLKASHPGLKTLLSIGGWTWSAGFPAVAASAASRTAFVSSCVAMMNQYGFDGLDIDWEYPVNGGLSAGTPVDTVNYTLLLQEFRNQMGNHLLTIAAPATASKMNNIEMVKVSKIIDWFNIMAYDFHGSTWENQTGFASALYPQSKDPSDHTFNDDSAVKAYLKLGIPSTQLVLGMPFYGRAWAGVPSTNNGVYQLGTGPATGSFEAGVYEYKYLKANNLGPSWIYGIAGVPYIYNSKTKVWVSYEDEISIGKKADYILSKNLGGGMIWSFDADNVGALLMNALSKIKGGGSVPTPSPTIIPTPGPTSTPIPTPAPTGCMVWTEGKSYILGQVVSYQGMNYVCIATHTAWLGTGWNPVSTPSLWNKGGVCTAPAFKRLSIKHAVLKHIHVKMKKK
jgi:chitinase